MGLIKRIIVSIIIALGCVALASCATAPIAKPQPVPFEEAVSSLASRLLDEIKSDSASAAKGPINVMLVPFADADSGEVPEVSRSIEKIIAEVGAQNYKRLNLARLTSKNFARADYLIIGTIRLKFYETVPDQTSPKNYHVTGEVLRLEDAKTIKIANAWISDMDLNYAPTAIFKDSPLYLQGSTLTKYARSQDPTYKQNFLDISLETRALLIEARTAYEEKDYAAAKALFGMAAEREDGQDLGTYAGLYLANQKLGLVEEAEKAFAKVVSISVEKYRYLTVKYLFGVNSADFLKDKKLEERYDTWIRHIGQYFQNADHCLRIVGHASHTGEEAYNIQLSLERAKSIQKRLKKSFPDVMQRSETIGKGFSENIVGIGSDDEHDALDRRVELIIVDCK